MATYIFSMHYQFCRSLHLLDLVFSHRGLHLNNRDRQRSRWFPAGAPSHPSPRRKLPHHSPAPWRMSKLWKTSGLTLRIPLNTPRHYQMKVPMIMLMMRVSELELHPYAKEFTLHNSFSNEAINEVK